MTRRMPYSVYDPASDASLGLWLDASDTTTLDKGGPVPITNGATILEWRTKAGTLRKYRLIGPNTAPTWNSGIQNGLGAVRANNQILSADVKTGQQSLTGRTVTCAFRQVANTPAAAEGYTITEPHQIANANGPQVLMYASTSAVAAGGYRLQHVPFVFFSAASTDPSGVGQRTVANNENFIVSAIFDYTNATIQIFDNGHSDPVTTGFSTAGSTAALDPYAMSVGGVLQETGGLGANTGNGFMNGYIFECLDWFSKLSLDQLFLANDYLRRKWAIA